MLQRIMLIDDSDDEALVLRIAFRKAGLEDPLFHVGDTDVALAYLAGDGIYANRSQYPLPDIVLLDLKMPQMDGFQILKWIRSQPHLARLFVIVVTSVTDARKIQLAYQLGANSFLSKDAAVEEVRNFVEFFRGFSTITGVLPKPPGAIDDASSGSISAQAS